MARSEIVHKVDKLEQAIMELVYAQRKTEMQIQNLTEQFIAFQNETREANRKRDEGMDQLRKEMLAFKNEIAELNKKRDQSMEEFKKEIAELNKKRDQSMEDFRNQMLAFKNEIAELNKKRDQSMEEFKKEIAELNRKRDLMLQEYEKKIDKNIEEMRRQWGNLANKMGTLVEDIFAPSLSQTIKKYFNCNPDTVIQRYYTRTQEKEIEIDLLGLCEEKKQAFVIEVKSSPDRVKYIEEFIEKTKAVKDFVPILKEYDLIFIYAGLSLNQSTVNLLTKNGIYAMVLKGDILEIVNFDQMNLKNHK